MVRVIGAPKRPQVLFIGFSEDDPEYQAMAAMVANAAILSTSPDEWLTLVRPAEWDAVVSCVAKATLHWVPSWMQVLSFNGSGTSMLARKIEAVDGWGHAIEYFPTGRQPSAILHVETTGVPEPLARLVSGELVPWLHSQDGLPYWVFHRRHQSNAEVLHGLSARLQGPALVTDADGNIVAGMFERAEGGVLAASGISTALVVPHMPAKPSLWFAAALEIWSSRDEGGRFADLPSWRATPQFQTVEERHAIDALAQLDRAHESAVRSYEKRRIELEAVYELARARADDGARRLLTQHDSPLVDAVASALSNLGFNVRDMDEAAAAGVAKMEDLRIADSSDPGWTNITEVKGHTRGAKTSVFIDISRFATSYLLAENELPTSRWYVVNQYRNDPPETRPDLLPGAASDVASFALDGGLVIDTRTLFQLVRSVEDGDLEADEVRKSLRTSTGIYSGHSLPTQ